MPTTEATEAIAIIMLNALRKRSSIRIPLKFKKFPFFFVLLISAPSPLSNDMESVIRQVIYGVVLREMV